MEFKLSWETTFQGKSAIFKQPNLIRITPALGREIALLKMTDISLISGYFQGAQILFYPWLWILFDDTGKLEFYGIYKINEEERDNDFDNHSLPSLCLRKCFWSMARERQAYQDAKNTYAYLNNHLFGKSHITANNIFVREKDASRILNLASDLSNTLNQGVTLNKSDTKEFSPHFQFLRINVHEDYTSFKISYSSYKYKQATLEEYALTMARYFTELKSSIGLNPEQNFRISYSSSVVGYISKLSLLE